MLQVPLDYHLPIVFSQPLALCYHQTPGFMGESWQWGEASETLPFKEH